MRLVLVHDVLLLLHDFFRFEDIIALVDSSLPSLKMLDFDGALAGVLNNSWEQVRFFIIFLMSF